MESNTATAVLSEELKAAASGELPHWIEEMVKRQKAYLRNYDIVKQHTQINSKRMPKEGQKPQEVHGSKIGTQFSRLATGAGQPFNGDLIPGQLVLRKKWKDKNKYNPNGSLKVATA